MNFYLETQRLILRPFEERDAEPFAAYRSDPEVARYQGWDIPYSLEKARLLASEMSTFQPGVPGARFQVAVELKSSQGLIGDFYIKFMEYDARQVEIGYTLSRAHQGKGYATEALTRLLAFLFDELEVHRVRANIDPDNTASARLLKRVGMRHEGRFIESLWFKGRWASEDWYGMLQKEWKEKH
jgi:RimJ/RimL family protein N-acetyltransferase